jgi:hypothetical protein
MEKNNHKHFSLFLQIIYIFGYDWHIIFFEGYLTSKYILEHIKNHNEIVG